MSSAWDVCDWRAQRVLDHPFRHKNGKLVGNLNSISELCCVVVFTVYWSRRREQRVQGMLLVGLFGVGIIVPFANRDQELVYHLNSISELCCAIVFLFQLAIVGYDLNRKIKFRTVLLLTRVAEALIVANSLVICVSIAELEDEDLLPPSTHHHLPRMCVGVTLLVIFGCRYYYIVSSHRWRELRSKRKLEMTWYFLFNTKYP